MIVEGLIACVIVASILTVVSVKLVGRSRDKRFQRPILPPPLPRFSEGHNEPDGQVVPELFGFFDFLKNRSDEEIMEVLKEEIPLYASVSLRFLPRDQRARLLSCLAPKERVQLEAMDGEKLSIDEVIRIADRIRRRILPGEGGELPRRMDEERFWRDTLERSRSKDVLVDALERTRPELRSVVDRFRIRLDEVPTFARKRREYAVSKLTDRELATALVDCPREVLNSILTTLSPPRKIRIVARIRALGRLPKSVTAPAVRSLLKRLQDSAEL